MKKIFILPMVIALAMICSCQRQDATAEQQLAQHKAEVDAREKVLDERLTALGERVNSLDERMKTLAAKERATANNAPSVPPDVQPQDVMRDAARLKALMMDPSRLNAAKEEKDRLAQERLTQQQRSPDKKRKSEIPGGAVFPAPETTSPTTSSPVEATSPTSSPTPQ